MGNFNPTGFSEDIGHSFAVKTDSLLGKFSFYGVETSEEINSFYSIYKELGVKIETFEQYIKEVKKTYVVFLRRIRGKKSLRESSTVKGERMKIVDRLVNFKVLLERFFTELETLEQRIKSSQKKNKNPQKNQEMENQFYMMKDNFFRLVNKLRQVMIDFKTIEEEFFEEIKKLKNDEIMEEYCQEIVRIQIKNTEEMIEKYLKWYDNFIKEGSEDIGDLVKKSSSIPKPSREDEIYDRIHIKAKEIMSSTKDGEEKEEEEMEQQQQQRMIEYKLKVDEIRKMFVDLGYVLFPDYRDLARQEHSDINSNILTDATKERTRKRRIGKEGHIQRKLEKLENKMKKIFFSPSPPTTEKEEEEKSKKNIRFSEEIDMLMDELEEEMKNRFKCFKKGVDDFNLLHEKNLREKVRKHIREVNCWNDINKVTDEMIEEFLETGMIPKTPFDDDNDDDEKFPSEEEEEIEDDDKTSKKIE